MLFTPLFPWNPEKYLNNPVSTENLDLFLISHLQLACALSTLAWVESTWKWATEGKPSWFAEQPEAWKSFWLPLPLYCHFYWRNMGQVCTLSHSLNQEGWQYFSSLFIVLRCCIYVRKLFCFRFLVFYNPG